MEYENLNNQETVIGWVSINSQYVQLLYHKKYPKLFGGLGYFYYFCIKMRNYGK